MPSILHTFLLLLQVFASEGKKITKFFFIQRFLSRVLVNENVESRVVVAAACDA